jgi:hypothetical protein
VAASGSSRLPRARPRCCITSRSGGRMAACGVTRGPWYTPQAPCTTPSRHR